MTSPGGSSRQWRRLQANMSVSLDLAKIATAESGSSEPGACTRRASSQAAGHAGSSRSSSLTILRQLLPKSAQSEARASARSPLTCGQPKSAGTRSTSTSAAAAAALPSLATISSAESVPDDGRPRLLHSTSRRTEPGSASLASTRRWCVPGRESTPCRARIVLQKNGKQHTPWGCGGAGEKPGLQSPTNAPIPVRSSYCA
mmetsp:Transcript_44337/g.109800  ORF Transcript_44337/g.109800 Transcript_44337/m.109800 type:complete len:201 (+) Transcript_44337:263-865(+)